MAKMSVSVSARSRRGPKAAVNWPGVGGNVSGSKHLNRNQFSKSVYSEGVNRTDKQVQVQVRAVLSR